VDLAPLVNVGMANLDRRNFAPMKYVDTALQALREDPVPEEVKKGSWRDIPDSFRYARHISYLAKKGVRVLGEVENPG